MNNLDFTRNLIKGKIAETIFSQMLRESGKFTVLEFGYEKIIAELARAPYSNDETLEAIRRAPDFAVINQVTKEVRLIEVKYHKTLRKNYILDQARRMAESWNPSYIFIASQEGFFFDEINMIVEKEGDISPLVHPFIPDELQKKYLDILIKFEANN